VLAYCFELVVIKFNDRFKRLKMKKITLIAIILLLSGCSTPEKIIWTHESKTDNQFITDEAKCNAGSMLMPRTTQLSAMDFQNDQRIYVRNCLLGEGWRIQKNIVK
jgi:uncharacterized lipoprotein YajG